MKITESFDMSFIVLSDRKHDLVRPEGRQRPWRIIPPARTDRQPPRIRSAPGSSSASPLAATSVSVATPLNRTTPYFPLPDPFILTSHPPARCVPLPARTSKAEQLYRHRWRSALVRPALPSWRSV
ncbi:hypothetical protein HPP92_013920 [Vanilla planifolia]|uniref:Uncharacterized protein n=1 Tax=Vanilla planifolia TaxID=51239 RepID=A0A835V128_VANPL|nr:hypothetical protein HPP92_013920 [Vanilla planifolia]